MDGQEQINNINFSIDNNNLYREESLTDLKVGSIRRLIPVKTDGTADDSRTEVFIGHTQLMSPEGPLPIQSELAATSLEEAIKVFPATMKQALQELIDKMQEMQRQQQRQEKDKSRIIIPGR
jgi:hypothetical protein